MFKSIIGPGKILNSSFLNGLIAPHESIVKTLEYLQKKYWSGGEPLLGEGLLESRRNHWFDSPVIILIEFEDEVVDITLLVKKGRAAGQRNFGEC